MPIEAFAVYSEEERCGPVPDGAGAGLAAVIEEALQRAGVEADARISGAVAIGEGWEGEITVADKRHRTSAAWERGHHLIAQLAEFAAREQSGALSEAVLRSFDDLATQSPAALLYYLAGRGDSGTGRLRLWRRAFELDPTLAGARTGLAREVLGQENVQGNVSAAAALLHGVAVCDGFTAAELGIALWARGEGGVSLELLQAAVQANPQHGLAMAALAALLARRTRIDGYGQGAAGGEALQEALLLATQATQLASDDFRTWAALGDVHRALGDFQQAGFYYGFALRLEPEAAGVLKDASACWLAARQPETALPLIERARAVAPLDAENTGNLAFAHLLRGDGPAALQAAREAAALGPDNANLHILHGELALRAGEREEALDAWARAAVLDPGITIDPEGGNLGLEAL
ncbi:MAG: hypothetical protein ACRD1Y_13630 [Terriglobales bacterium]